VYEQLPVEHGPSKDAVTRTRQALLAPLMQVGSRGGPRDRQKTPAVQVVINTPMLRSQGGRHVVSMSSHSPGKFGKIAPMPPKPRKVPPIKRIPLQPGDTVPRLRRMSISMRKMQKSSGNPANTLVQIPITALTLTQTQTQSEGQMQGQEQRQGEGVRTGSTGRAVSVPRREVANEAPWGEVARKRAQTKKALTFLRDYGTQLKRMLRATPSITILPLTPIAERPLESALQLSKAYSQNDAERPESPVSTETNSPQPEAKLRPPPQRPPMMCFLTLPDEYESEAVVLPSAGQNPQLKTPCRAKSSLMSNSHEGSAPSPQRRSREDKKRRATTPNKDFPFEHASTFAASIERLAIEPIPKTAGTMQENLG
jgi:hypothetical protein